MRYRCGSFRHGEGMAGPERLAYVITSKFADYLPLYRLESTFARSGLEIDRAMQ